MTSKIEEKKIFKICSLFSGCGGMDLGAIGGFSFQGKKLKRLPTEIVFSNDIDADAANAYNSNLKLFHHKETCRLEDIRKVPTTEIPDFDILHGENEDVFSYIEEAYVF